MTTVVCALAGCNAAAKSNAAVKRNPLFSLVDLRPSLIDATYIELFMTTIRT
jgi:hypothetical protein